MSIRKILLEQLRKRCPGLAVREEDLWDILPASQGLTIILNDGAVLPLPIGEGAARQLLHSWSVEARQN